MIDKLVMDMLKVFTIRNKGRFNRMQQDAPTMTEEDDWVIMFDNLDNQHSSTRKFA